MLTPTFPIFPILTTERLTLRQLLESDVDEIFLLRSDVTINKYLDRQLSKTPEDALNFIRKINSNKLFYWAITMTGKEKPIGTICLFDVSYENKKCEIGYELLSNYQGQGLMTEAIGKIIEFATQILELKIIDAYSHKDNISSTNLLKKYNFQETGIIDETNSDLVAFRLSY